MMKKHIIIAWCFLMLLVSCSPKSEYTNALPKDASVMMAMDLMSMAQKAGLDGDAGHQISQKLADLLKGGLEGDAAKLAEQIVYNPSESGLNFHKKFYFFATPHANAWGFVAELADEGKLEDLMKVLHQEQIASDIKKEGGCQWVQLGQTLCAFNKGTFLWLQNKKGDAENIKGMLFSLMRQKDGEGYASLPEFQTISQGTEDIHATIDVSILPDRFITPLRMGLPGDISLQDIRYHVVSNFEKGRLSVHSQLLTQNQKIKSFISEMNQVTTHISGKYMDYFPANTFAWMGGRIEGKTFYDMLYQNPTLRHELLNPELPVDMKRIFSAIEGDCAVGYSSLVSEAFLVYADVTNSDFLETFEELRPLLAMTGGQVQLFDTAENQYALKTMEEIYWFGVKGNFLYITNRRELAAEAGRTYGVSVGTRPWSSEGKNNRMFASVNFSRLATDMKEFPYFLPSLGNQQIAMILKLIAGELEVMNVSMPDWSQGQMELLLKDKKTNPLQLVVQIVNNL